jgi:hypothetical protein
MADVHVMLDLETWGTLPGCALRSIGAVTFDPFGEKDLDYCFYANIDRVSCETVGLKIDPETEAWWGKQPPEAQDALAYDPWALSYAAAMFDAWWVEQKATHLWSNGACFDEPILRVAFDAVARRIPWKYWNVRDTRTIWDIAGLDPRNVQRAGPAHHALHDARHQARCVTLAYQRLGLRPPMRGPVTLRNCPVAITPGVITEAAVSDGR